MPPKNSYSKTVTTSASVIVPKSNDSGVSAFAAGAIAEGDYVTANGQLYWALGAGTGVTAPSHKRGIVTVDGIDWLHVDKNRDEVTIGRNHTPTVDDGIILSGPYDMRGFTGEVQAIASVSTVVAISCQ
jgi:hypothetical protein